MKRFLLPLLAAISLPTTVNANVDPEVHKLCLPAADYLGCVKAMTTKSTDIPSMRIIEGKTELSGNSCPSGFAYGGGGICRSWRRNILSDEVNIDSYGLWKAGQAELTQFRFSVFDDGRSKAVYDPSCPDKEPYLYTSNSCAEKPSPPTTKEIKRFLWWIGGQRKARWDNDFERAFGIPNMASDALKRKEKPVKTNVTSGSVKINCDSPVWKNKPRCN